MAEVVIALVDIVEREDERGVHQLLDRRLDLLERAVDHARDDIGAEAPAQDGAGAGERPCVGREAGQARQHRVGDRVGDVDVADPPTVGAGLVIERREELLDVERDPVRPRVDRLDDFPGSRQLAAQDQRRREARLVSREGAQPDLLGEPLAQQARPPLAVDRVDRELLAAIVGDDDERQVREVAGELADHLEAHLVGPVEILEDEHRRSVDRLEDAIRHVPDDQPPGAQPVAVVPAVDREEVLGERAPRRIAADPGRELADRRERDGMVLRRDRPGGDTDAGGLCLADRGPDQAGLPEAGLAGKEQRPAPALGTRGDGRVEQLEDVVAPDDDRALDRAGSTHGAESTARTSQGIGRSTDRRLNRAGAPRS